MDEPSASKTTDFQGFRIPLKRSRLLSDEESSDESDTCQSEASTEPEMPRAESLESAIQPPSGYAGKKAKSLFGSAVGQQTRGHRGRKSRLQRKASWRIKRRS